MAFIAPGSRWLTWGVPVAAAVAGAGIAVGVMTWLAPQSEAASEAFGPEGTGTQTTTVSLQTLEQSVSATGSLVAVRSDTAAFEASGKVTAVYVQEGDVVAEGDVLAEIDTLQLQADLASAQADLAQAEATLANAKDVDDGSTAADRKIESAQADVGLKQEYVADAEAAMAGYRLVAPMPGLVTSQPYAVGNAVSGGSASPSGSSGSGTSEMGGFGSTISSTSSSGSSTGVQIVGQDEWTVTVSLTEAQVALIAVGNQVTFTADGRDTFFGIVSNIAALPSTSSGTAKYPVTLQLTSAVDGLFEGVSVTAEIVYLRKVDVLAVPANAVATADGVSTVTVVDAEGNETEREVVIGENYGSYTEVLSGLSEGESVVATVFSQGGGQGTGGFELPDGFEFPQGGLPGGGSGFPGGDFGGGFPGGAQ